jgi:quinol monooxygenase YgiN
MGAYVYVWAFRVAPSQREDFEHVYGPDGAWSMLFAQSNGYVSTTLLEDRNVDGRYVTIDRWRDEESYSRFHIRFAEDYATLDQACEGLTEHEESLGSYFVVD